MKNITKLLSILFCGVMIGCSTPQKIYINTPIERPEYTQTNTSNKEKIIQCSFSVRGYIPTKPIVDSYIEDNYKIFKTR